jgi:hypothetical protein
MKSSQGIRIMLSKWATIISRMPYRRRIRSARSAAELISGVTAPVMRLPGWASNVKAVGTASSAAAFSRTRLSRAPWPVCTPSKKPRAMTRLVSFKVVPSFLLQISAGSDLIKALDGL